MGATLENEELVRLALGRKVRGRRLSRALLARLIGERFEAEDEDEEGESGEEGGDENDDRRIARLLIGSRILRRRRLRNLLLAHLLREKGEAQAEGDEGEEEGEEGGNREQKLVRLLIASRILRRRRVRHMLLAHLLRERGEAEDEDFEDEEDEGAEGAEGDERKLLRLLAGKRMPRRRRARRMLLAHLLREKSEAGDEDDMEGDEDAGDEEGGDSEGRIMRLLIGSRILRKRRARRMLLAHLLHERGEEEA